MHCLGLRRCHTGTFVQLRRSQSGLDRVVTHHAPLHGDNGRCTRTFILNSGGYPNPNLGGYKSSLPPGWGGNREVALPGVNVADWP